MKRWISLITFICFLSFPAIKSEAKPLSIQEQIDQAKAGDTIQIPSGVYKESIIIDKPLQLLGEGQVQLQVESERAAISIQANDVTLQDLTILYHNHEKKQAAILVQGDRNHLKNIQIETSNRGVFLDKANHNQLENIHIQGDPSLAIQMRQRGIDLWESHHNEIHHNEIAYVEDGIYMESSYQNSVHHNKAVHSRYGYHLMFTKETELFKNESYENISGMMVMGTKGSQVYDNILAYNQENVQSLGLLLFDVRDARVEANKIHHNRIGIFVEDASENMVRHNDVRNNFIGLQFKRAEDNTIQHNSFSANVVQGQAEYSTDNDTNFNYWSDHRGLDMTGDDLSNLPYTVDPFYLHLTNKYPPYRLLFQSPGFVFLESMMHTPVEQQLVDHSPLMNNPIVEQTRSTSDQSSMLLVSSLLFILSLASIYLGVRQA